MLTTKRYGTVTFFAIIVRAYRLGLMENTDFQTWAVSGLMQINDGLQADVGLRQIVTADSEASWLICCALASLVGGLGAEHGYSRRKSGGRSSLTPKKAAQPEDEPTP